VAKKILLLGNTGKKGTALSSVFSTEGYSVSGKNSSDFDAMDFESVREMVRSEKPDIVMNSVAFLGIDPSENEPDKAFKMNSLYPKVLAELSSELGFVLVHFSTDAVFSDIEPGACYTEEDTPSPLNVYGLTKYGGDCFVRSGTETYYIIRISVQFGETAKTSQFVEKMLHMVNEGKKELCISDDIVSSPTYSHDVAMEVKRIIENDYPYGLYHVANEGPGTLYELMKEIVEVLDLDVVLKKASYKDFPYIGRKNLCTPLTSVKLNNLRHWKDAVRDYCARGD
jgi:dTDP-4-dehydrorhamnose reductase